MHLLLIFGRALSWLTLFLLLTPHSPLSFSSALYNFYYLRLMGVLRRGERLAGGSGVAAYLQVV